MESKSVITESFKAIQAALEALEPLDLTQRQFALSMILKGLGMSERSPDSGTNDSPANNSNRGSLDINSLSPRDFLREKKPHTDLERLTCLAYYLTHARGVTHFKTEEISALNTEAAGTKFANASATARNAVSQSRYLSHATKGKKQLTPLGEDVVNALPDRELMSKVISEAPKPRKQRGKPTTKKKKTKKDA